MSKQNAALDRAFLDQQRERLEALRKQLLGAEGRALKGDREFQEQHGEEAEEIEGEVQRLAQNEVNQALHNLDGRRLRAIERALQKIKEGTYGLSDKSGAQIPRARLESAPEAVLTVHEEEQMER
jgi:DnaK suppressor protein